MPRLSTVLLIARLALAPVSSAVPAAAAEPPAATKTDTPAAMSQDHIKDLFFDAARQGRDDLVSGLVDSGMKIDARDQRGYTALIIAAYNGQAKTVDLLIQEGTSPCATDLKGNSSLMGVAVTSAKPRAISGASRIDPVSVHATMAEIRHAVTWCRRLLHLRARGFADVACRVQGRDRDRATPDRRAL
jgi:ankyrin repeat protein